MSAYTKAEVRRLLLEHVACLVDYWDQDSRAPTPRRKLDGLAFSIMAMLDGASVGEVPKFVVAPDPHPEDRPFRQAKRRKWFPETVAVDNDISGELHDHFAVLMRRRRQGAKTAG